MISAKLVVTLLTAIAGYTGYAIPGEPPRITTLSHAELEQRVCGRPCQVFGFTWPDGEITIDEALAIGSDPAATSILVHELTHFLQMKSVAHPQPVTCQIWRDREREAFGVQAQWLRDHSGSVQTFSVAMRRLNLGVPVHTLCLDRSNIALPESWSKG
ncbi:hypothetical protein [Dongia deserti]|uniref:hypothetical protein n=1 Tax=Dongia deserti TaxID=2268030 RepID=UPI000E64E84C|nr:hypothetical protein [Dongia deserti]